MHTNKNQQCKYNPKQCTYSRINCTQESTVRIQASIPNDVWKHHTHMAYVYTYHSLYSNKYIRQQYTITHTGKQELRKALPWWLLLSLELAFLARANKSTYIQKHMHRNNYQAILTYIHQTLAKTQSLMHTHWWRIHVFPQPVSHIVELSQESISRGPLYRVHCQTLACTNKTSMIHQHVWYDVQGRA